MFDQFSADRVIDIESELINELPYVSYFQIGDLEGKTLANAQRAENGQHHEKKLGELRMAHERQKAVAGINPQGATGQQCENGKNQP